MTVSVDMTNAGVMDDNYYVLDHWNPVSDEFVLELTPGAWDILCDLRVGVTRPINTPGTTNILARLCYSEDGGTAWHAFSDTWTAVSPGASEGHFSPHDGFVRLVLSISESFNNPNYRRDTVPATVNFPTVTVTDAPILVRLETKYTGAVYFYPDSRPGHTGEMVNTAVIASDYNGQSMMKAIKRS